MKIMICDESVDEIFIDGQAGWYWIGLDWIDL